MRWLARLIAVVVVAWCFWRPGVAYASGCRPDYPERQFLAQREVFLGRVDNIEDLGNSPFPQYAVTMSVHKTWKGELPLTVAGRYLELPTAFSGKPSPLVEGRSYIVYSKGYDGIYSLAPCARLVPMGLGAWHDVLLLTAWDLRLAVPVLIGLQVLLRWRGRRAARVTAGSA